MAKDGIQIPLNLTNIEKNELLHVHHIVPFY